VWKDFIRGAAPRRTITDIIMKTEFQPRYYSDVPISICPTAAPKLPMPSIIPVTVPTAFSLF